LANADVTAIVPDAMSKLTGAEAKASVHALSTIAAMIFDMSMFLFVMVDKETAEHRPLRHLAPPTATGVPTRARPLQSVKNNEKSALSFPDRADRVWGKSPDWVSTRSD